MKDIKPNIKMKKTVIEIETFLENSFGNYWKIQRESTKTIRLKSKKFRGISLLISLNVDLMQSGSFDYRKVSLEKVSIDKPENRKIKPEELSILNKTMNLIKNFLSN